MRRVGSRWRDHDCDRLDPAADGLETGGRSATLPACDCSLHVKEKRGDAVSIRRRAAASVDQSTVARIAGQATAQTAERIGDRMALGFYITGKGFTQENYDTTLGQLRRGGRGSPGWTDLPRRP